MAQKNILTNFTVVAGVEGQNTLQSLAKQLDGLSFSAKKLGNDLRSVSGGSGIQQITKDSENAKRSVSGLADALNDYRVKIVAAGFAAQQFVKTLAAILEVQGRIDQLEVGLNLVNDGNTRKIADDLEFLKDTTNRLGLEFTQTSVLYTKFAAAAKESGFSASQTREVFDSFAGATARLSLSADSANRVFFALQQIVSKGTVSSEELKNQLGEKIPGVMAIAAKAFDGGKGDIEAFNKALADGKVQVDDFLIPFAEGIRESLGVASGESVNTATAAFGRFKNSYDDLLRTVVDSGLGDVVVRLFDGATVAIGDASESIRDLKADTQAFFDAIDFEALQLLAEVFVGLKGASVGAATGAAIGSIVPGVGTAVGAAVGAGVGYLGGAAATNEVVNQARFGKQEEFNRLLERQVSIEKEIIEVTKRRDSAYGKNFLNQKALTEEIQSLQMEGIQIDLQLINSNKQVSESVVEYGKEINKTFQEADNLDKAEQRAAKAADKRKDQLKGLTEELDGVNKKYVEGKKVLDASLAAGDIDIAQYNKRLKQLADSTAKKGKENTAYKSFIKSLDEQNTKFKEELGLIQKRTETDKLRERALEATKGKIDKVTEAKLKENAALEASLKLQNELKEIRKQEADFAQDLKISARQEADDIANRNKQIEDEIARIGLKTEALAELEAQALMTRAAQSREAAEDVGGFNPTLYAERIRQAEELEKQAALVRKKAGKEAAIERAEEQKKANQEIVDDFVDLFKNVSTQSGKQFADDLKRAVQIKFQSFVIRVGVEAALNTAVGSAITGFNTQGGGAAGILQSAGAFANLGAASNTFANAAVFASAKLAEFAGLSTAATGSLTGFAASAGAAVPYIGAALAGLSVINSLRSDKISTASLGPQFNADLQKTLQAAYISAAQSLGGTANANAGFITGGNTGRQGQNPNFSFEAQVNGTAQYKVFESQLNDTNVALESLRATFALLQADDFADNIDSVVDGVNFTSASFEELSAALQNAQILNNINVAFKDFEGALSALSGASLETVQSFLQLTGGLEGLQAGYATFVDLFFSDSEKLGMATDQIGAVFAGLGESVPSTLAAYRDLIEGQDLLTESGRVAYASLLNLAPAFAGTVQEIETQLAQAYQNSLGRAPDTEGLQFWLNGVISGSISLEQAFELIGGSAEALAFKTTESAQEVVTSAESIQAAYERLTNVQKSSEQIAQERINLEQELFGLTASATQQIQAQRDALDESNRALFDQIQAFKDQAAAAQAAEVALRDLEAKRLVVLNESQRLELAILRASGEEAKAIAIERQVELDRLRELDPALVEMAQKLFGLQDAANSAGQSIEEVGKKIDSEFGSSLATTITNGLLGNIDGELIGAQFSDIVVGGIYNALANQASQQITQILIDGVVNPMVQAALAGANISTIVSKASIDEMVSMAENVAKVYSSLINNPEFQSAVNAVGSALSGLGSILGGVAKSTISYSSKVDLINARRDSESRVDPVVVDVDPAIQERIDLERRLDDLLRGSVAVRERELEAISPSNRSLLERIFSIQDEQESLRELSEIQNQIASERFNLETRLFQAQGDVSAIRERELAALDPSNAVLQMRIWQIEDERAANEALIQQQAAIASERFGLETRLLQLQGDTAALRERELMALDPSNRAILEQIFALEDLKAAGESVVDTVQDLSAVLREREGLELELLRLQGNTVEILRREREAIDDSNRGLFDQIQALKSSQEAAELAKQAQEQLASAQQQAALEAQRLAEAVASERFGLEGRLLELQGNTAALRARELAALDESNRGLLEQIFALEDQQAAIRESQNAFERLQEAIKSATETVFDEVSRLRGLDSTSENQAQLQSQFAILTAQARSGDVNALAQLPDFTKAIEQAALVSASSFVDVARIRANLANSLETSARTFTMPAINIQSPQNPVQQMSQATTQAMGDMVAELRELKKEVEMLRVEARVTAVNTGKIDRKFDDVTQGGTELRTKVIA